MPISRTTQRRPLMPLNTFDLDNGELGGGDVQSVNVRSKAGEGLLGAVRPEKYVSSHVTSRSFLDKAYLIMVLICTTSTSYNFFRASLIWRLLALTSTMKTRVLFSSIFFMALSVLSGWMMTLEASRRGWCGIDLRGYLGARDRVRVLGRWKEVDVRTFLTLCELTCAVKNRPSE
jgi:hypothetical protein